MVSAVVPVLLLSTLFTSGFAGRFCQVNGGNITCKIYDKDSDGIYDDLEDDLPAVPKTGRTDVTLIGDDFLPQYFGGLNNEQMMAWRSIHIKSLTVRTNGTQAPFQSLEFCYFCDVSQYLTKVDFSASSRYYDSAGNFTDLPNLSCLGKLQEFAIANNKITALTSDSLKGLKSLKKFDVHRNKIYRVASDVFTKNTPNLQEINLGFNKIKYLPKTVFNGLQNLQYLYLGGNKLRSIDNLFEFVPKLNTLVLDYNRLHVVKKDTFNKSGVPKISYIGLGNNNIKRMEPGAFSNLDNLVQIETDHNNLKAIETGTLVGLPKLTKALFGYNYISYIGDNAFAGTPNLKYLELWSNSLTSLNESSFGSLWSSITLVDLGENKFKCSCDLKWIVDLHQTKKQPDLIFSCYSDKLKKYIDLKKATLKDILCE